MYKIGLSSCGFELTEENFKALKKSNIDCIEISMLWDKYKDIDYKQLKELSARYEIGLWSYHLPFYPWTDIEPSSPDKAMRDHTIQYFTELINKASDIGIDKFIVHASGEPIAEEDREERLKYAMQSMDELAEIAHKCGAVVAVEDLPRTCLGNTSDDISKLISVNDKLRVCFDTNHLLQEDNIEFMKKLADKIITLHISDYDFLNERHWLPGEGKLDWIAMFSTLKEIGYNGVWMYEINLECPDTITRDRNLTFDDFYNNAKSIFAQKKPTVLGIPKENLGGWR